MGRVNISTGTFGKALGGASGGYTSARQEIVDLLRQRSHPYLFSNTVVPAIASATLAALDLILPIMLGEARLASKMAERLLEKGTYVVGFSFPVVRKGLARIRIQISAAHTSGNIDYVIEQFAAVRTELIN